MTNRVGSLIIIFLRCFTSAQAFVSNIKRRFHPIRSAYAGISMAPKVDVTDVTDTTISRHRVDGTKGYVSARGASNLGVPMPYLTDFFKALGDMCHAETNPHGYVPVCVAENRLVSDLLEARLGTSQTAQVGFTGQESYSYNSPVGITVMREAVANLLQERFLSPEQQQKESTTIDPNHIVIGAGAINILSNLFFALGEPRDAVLIPSPYYAAFDNDVRAYAGCIPVPVVCDNPTLGPSIKDLERAREHAQETLGLNVRFLLLTNPHNPLGVVYEPRVLTDAIGWARSHQMDTVMDEIYALSVFDDSRAFHSILQIFDNQLGDDLHLVWGLSKDFGASGFRVGVLYTQNELLLQATFNLFGFSWVSQPVQLMMAEMLNDKPFVEDFLAESRQRLRGSYELCANVLKQLQIPFVQAHAGMFVYLDLSELISTVEEEAQFVELLTTRARVIMTPGTTQHDPKPGKFRICYAYVSVDVLDVGMKRLGKVVAIIRQQGGLGPWIEDDSYWQDVL